MTALPSVAKGQRCLLLLKESFAAAAEGQHCLQLLKDGIALSC
jgi:hypothetical protein